MRATVIAMIGEEEHQRVFGLARRLQGVQHLAEQGVFHRAVGPVMGDRLAHLLRGKLVPVLAAHPLIDARFVLEAIGVAGGQGDRRRVVHTHEALRHAEGIVGADRADEECPRLREARQAR